MTGKRNAARWKALPKGIQWRELPVPPPGPQLALDSPAKDSRLKDCPVKAAKPKALKLKAPAERVLERPVMRSIVKHLNNALKRGGVFHIVNEQGLLDLLPPERRNVYLNALMADGMLLGAPDLIAFWAMPEAWRKCLEDNGFIVPPEAAMCGFPEVKAPGWKPDKAWWAGNQAKAHDWIRRCGAPVEVVQGWVEAHELLVDWGAEMRLSILRGSAVREPRPNTRRQESTGGTKKARKQSGARAPQKKRGASGSSRGTAGRS